MSKLLVVKINDNSLEVAHIDKAKTVNVLVTFSINFDIRISSDTGIYSADGIAYHLRKELAKRHIKTKQVIFLVNTSVIYARRVDVFKRKNEQEFLELLKSKIVTDNVFPIALDDYYITYSKLGSYFAQIDEEKEDNNKESVNASLSNIQGQNGNNQTNDVALNTTQEISANVNTNAENKNEEESKKQEQTTYKKVDSNLAKNKNVVEVNECMVYVAPKTFINGIEEIAKYARLEILNIEYAGNSVYQYVLSYSGEDIKKIDWILLHITNTNTIITSVSNGKMQTQNSISFSYNDICQPFYENYNLFKLNNPNDIFKFIQATDFLSKDETKQGYEQFSKGTLEYLKNFDDNTKGIILGVQTQILEKYIQLTDGVNVILMNCRSKNMRPQAIYYFNENPNFPNITDTLEYYSKLPIMPIGQGAGVNLSLLASAINPVDFDITANINKAKAAITKKYITYEAIFTLAVIGAMSITSLSKQTTLQVQNRQLKKQMESATEAKSTYMKYMGLRDTFEQLEEYDNKTMSLLNQIDEIYNEMEKKTPNKKYLNIVSINANEEQLTISVTADSKDTVVAFTQQLEEIDYVEKIDWKSLTEVIEGDSTYATNRKVTTSFTVVLQTPPVPEEDETDESIDNSEEDNTKEENDEEVKTETNSETKQE